ncbi:hypothetical protein CHUAL_013619 [Chamberlinius hualienensis]
MSFINVIIFGLLHFLTVVWCEDVMDTSNSLTCYTCTGGLSNQQCNRYAVDKPCPNGNEFCQTIHVMDVNGETMSVVKSCANHLQCNSQNVGCKDMDAEGGQGVTLPNRPGCHPS